jgi:PmbA protein
VGNETLNEIVLEEATKLEADDAIALSTDYQEAMVRFANNSITVAKRLRENSLLVYLAKRRRRALAASTNPEEKSIRRFVRDLFESLKSLPPDSGFAPLPAEGHTFSSSTRHYDRKLETIGNALPDLAKQAIDAAIQAGAARSAGALVAGVSKTSILTTSGTKGSDRSSEIDINIRSFANHDASGHGLSCSADLSGFNPSEAGRRAGGHAKRMKVAKACEPGQYDIIMSPTVAANLLSLVGEFASAFSVDAGISFLTDKLNQVVAAESFSLTDHGAIEGGLESRVFDDEGLPTQKTKIIDHGTLKNYLHNLSTAKRLKTRSTGNAGIIDPHPWNLEVGRGDSSFDEMTRETKRGVVLTSNWYTRFKSYRSGEFSTVPRDGTYLVENGAVTTPLNGLRVSDTLERWLKSIKSTSAEREWVKWWEVDVPTFCPWVLSSDVKITKAYG